MNLILPQAVLAFLTELTLTGFYGRTQEETLEILLKEKLREIRSRHKPPAEVREHTVAAARELPKAPRELPKALREFLANSTSLPQ